MKNAPDRQPVTWPWLAPTLVNTASLLRPVTRTINNSNTHSVNNHTVKLRDMNVRSSINA